MDYLHRLIRSNETSAFVKELINKSLQSFEHLRDKKSKQDLSISLQLNLK